jgi:myo-inositol-1(or 4)-monophosphatase
VTDVKSIEERFRLGVEVIREAGELAMTYFNARESLTVQTKGPQDLASEADLNTEILIRKRIMEAFPEDAFMGEETEPTDYDPEQGLWVVDPIDGTQPFICGMSCWCVSIAFMKGGRLEFGMVNSPARNELFAGGRDFPSTLNGKPIKGHVTATIKDGLTGTGYSLKSGPKLFLPAFQRFLEAGGMFYRDGSGALSLCYVAAGRLVAFFEPVIKSWDCLGGMAVVEGVGLQNSDFLANDGLHKGNRLVSGNATVCAEIEELIAGSY